MIPFLTSPESPKCSGSSKYPPTNSVCQKRITFQHTWPFCCGVHHNHQPLHEKINPENWQVISKSLGDAWFLQFLRVVSRDYGKLRAGAPFLGMSEFTWKGEPLFLNGEGEVESWPTQQSFWIKFGHVAWSSPGHGRGPPQLPPGWRLLNLHQPHRERSALKVVLKIVCEISPLLHFNKMGPGKLVCGWILWLIVACFCYLVDSVWNDVIKWVLRPDGSKQLQDDISWRKEGFATLVVVYNVI